MGQERDAPGKGDYKGVGRGGGERHKFGYECLVKNLVGIRVSITGESSNPAQDDLIYLYQTRIVGLDIMIMLCAAVVGLLVRLWTPLLEHAITTYFRQGSSDAEAPGMEDYEQDGNEGIELVRPSNEAVLSREDAILASVTDDPSSADETETDDV